MTHPVIVHGGLVIKRIDQVWRGALIEGRSGSGKSDLMLRLLDLGFRLVADDRAVLWRSNGTLYGRAPDPLRGLIEARGVGILTVRAGPLGPVDMVVRCETEDQVDRMPEPGRLELVGEDLPLLTLNALEASAPGKLRRALERLGTRADGA